MHIGGGVTSVNLACSGARTYSRISDGKFKPGIDFYATRAANKGQALALQELRGARPTNIKAVVVLIGANDYGFADIVADVRDRLADVAVVVEELLPGRLEHAAMFSASNITAITDNVRAAPSRNVKTAMAARRLQRRRSTRSSPRPTPRRCRCPVGIRYGETGFTRQTVGGCGVVEQRRQLGAQHGRRTRSTARSERRRGHGQRAGARHGRARSTAAGCARTRSGCSRRRASRPGRSPGAVDKTEWVQQIRTLTTLFPPYQLQEDGHPNYWGQLALRNCFRQAYNGGAPRGGYVLARHRAQRQGRAEHGARLADSR